MSKIVNTGVKLDETLHNRLKQLGVLKARTPHWLMRTAIEEYVEREEAYEREKQEDVERWQRYQTLNHAIPHEQVSAWLGSIGTGNEQPCPK
ncbi:CopG family ribbon-helix-helix protein [Gloeobacter kilaueensis]|uniref:Trifunctional transcriptional regulator/proline dehydrogenase/pyrroline-5-carboxylate dehydrogenase n=1 Tax=Gloeobacter kilaueensis (strain ATCC BAA-2537 / CCAP 1431/1 / ULC 316 / JS1) TaxID=1183438 RepID=U5QN10_GLOK1|nr:trifunctional transcriptional regulator/proline dehydrogenase/pyrroline-5-carboxylate dehydrogenase [Gloeobacter kilaueensis]AGY60357.1 trifunctional transcriptional regulator/proline dehydrogenase/pyrroline-5-carboxylate dehydrogenase [Gloeobacter kilaueensis JS1]